MKLVDLEGDLSTVNAKIGGVIIMVEIMHEVSLLDLCQDSVVDMSCKAGSHCIVQVVWIVCQILKHA
jgi:hypothetical protein